MSLQSIAEKPLYQLKSANGVVSSSGYNSNTNTIQHRATPPIHCSMSPPESPLARVHEHQRLSIMSEGEEEKLVDANEFSSEIQAHNISTFLSSSASDSGELKIACKT